MKRYCRKSAMFTIFVATFLSWTACSGGEKHASPLDTTYWIEGRACELSGGKSRIEAAPGSATMITTSVYGPYATGDLNGDGAEDTGVILVQEAGGSGTFYYAAAAIKKDGRYEGTHATLLGDRVVPVDIRIEKSVMEVVYRDRLPDEPMAADVSVEKSVRLVLKDDRLEVMPVFNSGALRTDKISFDLSRLNEDGLYGPEDGKRALSYEFCIPDTEDFRAEIKRIDSSVAFSSGSPGRAGCGEGEVLCIGSTHQKNYRNALKELANLPYVQGIDECFFE